MKAALCIEIDSTACFCVNKSLNNSLFGQDFVAGESITLGIVGANTVWVANGLE